MPEKIYFAKTPAKFVCTCVNCGDEYLAACEDSKRCPKCRTGKRRRDADGKVVGRE